MLTDFNDIWWDYTWLYLQQESCAITKMTTRCALYKWIKWAVAEIWPFAYLGGRGGRRGSAMAPFERAMLISYELSIVAVVLSVTIRPQFAIKCLLRSNQQGVGHFGPKFLGVSLGVDPWCLGLQRANIPNKLMVDWAVFYVPSNTV